MVVGTGRPVSEVCKRFEPLPQLLQNVRYADGAPLEQEQVKKAIDVGPKRLGGQGRLVIRPSGTEPVIRVMAEGDDEGLVHQVVGDIVEAVKRPRSRHESRIPARAKRRAGSCARSVPAVPAAMRLTAPCGAPHRRLRPC